MVSCSLIAPSHYLNQYRLIINKDVCNTLDWFFFRGSAQDINLQISLEITDLRSHPHVPGASQFEEKASKCDIVNVNIFFVLLLLSLLSLLLLAVLALLLLPVLVLLLITMT